ncbi:hypothetical protein PIB30_032398, partial [Stylosanthes scabra]|nr:hypothetical protein [Stylosanthes scabra]
NGLVPLSDKLDENNLWTRKKFVLLTIGTLKLEDHLNLSKTPSQFEEITTNDEIDSNSTPRTLISPLLNHHLQRRNPHHPPLSKNQRNSRSGLNMIRHA